MDFERVLQRLIDFINTQTEQANAVLNELRAKESKLEGMDLKARLAYLKQVRPDPVSGLPCRTPIDVLLQDTELLPVVSR